ncbi:MAG: pimeloyl-ACP methyl ester carboxylesterase [Planctomycetota bacterium]|jgi:pimeloyl-ACP methyl ester carboxylesterase
MVKRIIRPLALFAGLYVLVCAGVFLTQDSILFPRAGKGRGRPLSLPQNVEVKRLTSALGDNYRIAVGHPEEAPRGILLWFLGNGADLSNGLHHAIEFPKYGLLTVVTEYPGYGESSGHPGIASIFSAAERTAEFGQQLARARDLDNLFLGGQSLGSFSATHLAHLGLGNRLLLISPPTSILEAGRVRFPWLPVGILLKHPFDNMSLAGEIDIRTLVVHGTLDLVAPVEMGQRLSQAFPDGSLVEVPGAGHNDLDLRFGSKLSDSISRHLFD